VSTLGDQKLSKTNYSWIYRISAHRWTLRALRRVSAPRHPSHHIEPSPELEEQASLDEK
jgi:hypothetical protein